MKDEFILVPLKPRKETRQFYYFEEVGGRIWELLDGRRRCDKIVEVINAEFKVHKEQAKEDVFTFLSDLKKEKLIRKV